MRNRWPADRATLAYCTRPRALPRSPLQCPAPRSYIAKLACEMQGRAECPLPGQWQHTLIFGGLQVIMSQLPNLER